MMRHILFLFLLIFLVSAVHADPIPSTFPYALITSSQGTSVHLSAEPGQKAIIYRNAILHIFAKPHTSYSVYIDSNLYVKNITESEHTSLQLHLNVTHHNIEVIISDKRFIFDVIVTRYAISEGGIQELQHLMEIPPWEWSAHEWAVFGDTVLGALLAIPFSVIMARYLILRKWGGANVIN